MRYLWLSAVSALLILGAGGAQWGGPVGHRSAQWSGDQRSGAQWGGDQRNEAQWGGGGPMLLVPVPLEALLMGPDHESDRIVSGSAAEVVYARPLARGGYSYRPLPVPPRAHRLPPPSPLIIRVKKHRIVRD